MEVVKNRKQGWKNGQHHHRAKFTDHEVEQVRRLYDDGMSITEIAEKMETSKGYVSDLVHYRRR